MDFIIGQPRITRLNESIKVIVDKMKKSSHFIHVKSIYKVKFIAAIFMKNVFKLHGFPKAIISNHDAKFTSNFWKGLFQELGTQLNFSMAYHLQTDDQTKRVNQVLKDMLRMYVMDKPLVWEDYLHLVEFAYNNGYHSSLGMSPYHAVYGWER